MSIGADSPARLQQLRADLERIATACGRDPAEVGLLAVSKQQSVAAIQALAAAGQQHFGENYLQEAELKVPALAALNLTWHFIGQLQSNKTRIVAERFAWVHTLDRAKIATRLNDQRPAAAAPLNVCIQVKLADEIGKGGVAPAQLLPLAQHVRNCPRLSLRGLMCIPPPSDDPDTQQRYFMQTRELLLALKAHGFTLDTLSMGMSGDYAAAIRAGATWVRLGTALFGPRH